MWPVAPVVAYLSSFSQVNFSGQNACPRLPAGDLTLSHFQLYPENFMWDKKRCVLYVSNLYNATLGIFDPYQSKILDVISFPGLSHSGYINDLHVSGLVLRPYADTLEILIDNGDAFTSGGNNVSGPDFIMTMDLNSKKVIAQANLTTASEGLYAGYADMEPLDDGNTYVVGSYPSNLLRVTPDNKVSTFYVKEPYGPPRLYGFTGITHDGYTLISNDNIIGQFVRFDVRDPQGTPIVIPQTPYHNFTTSNILELPERYNKTILLATENFIGTEYPSGGVGVYRSKDRSWESLEYLGFVPSRFTFHAFATGARQITDRIYVVSVYMDGENIYVAGDSSDFVLQDITEAVDALVAA